MQFDEHTVAQSRRSHSLLNRLLQSRAVGGPRCSDRGLGPARHRGILGGKGPARKGWAASSLWFSLGLVTSPAPAPFQLAASLLTALWGPSRPSRSHQLTGSRQQSCVFQKGVGRPGLGRWGPRQGQAETGMPAGMSSVLPKGPGAVEGLRAAHVE